MPCTIVTLSVSLLLNKSSLYMFLLFIARLALNYVNKVIFDWHCPARLVVC